MKKRPIDPQKVRELASQGLNDTQIAESLGFHSVTFCRRKGKDEQIRDALEKGREGLEPPSSNNFPVDPEKFLPVDVQFKTDDETMVSRIEDKITRILHYLDDEKLAKANATTLATSLGILIDKRRLLQGQPTAILSHEERQELNELIPRLIEEARRRGMAIDVEPVRTLPSDSD